MKLKTIYQFDLDGNFINKWNSITEAANTMDGRRSLQNISACVLGKGQYSAYGSIWLDNNDAETVNERVIRVKFIKEENQCKAKLMQEKIKKPILMLDKDTDEVLKEFPSLTAAKINLGLRDVSGITNVLKGKYRQSAGFKWVYAK